MAADVQRERVVACHWLLLRLAGTLPDALITQCRAWLAEARTSDVGRSVTYAVSSQRIRLTDPEIDLLAELLGAADVDTLALSMVDVLDSEPLPRFAFAARRADADRGARLGAADDRPRTPVSETAPDDAVDRAVLAEMHSGLEIRALWRVWRFPDDGAPWPRPRRVYVVEVDRATELAGTTAWLQAVAANAGETDPQIEVYPVHARLPSYQRLARAYGALIWTRHPDPGVRIAVSFGQADPNRARTAADWQVIRGSEVALLVDYLSGGQPLLFTTTPVQDAVDPARGAVVPMNFRTDGHWIWTDAAVYYLKRYGLAPDADLVAHVHQQRFVVPEVDGAAIHRALAALQEPEAEGPAWIPGT